MILFSIFPVSLEAGNIEKIATSFVLPINAKEHFFSIPKEILMKRISNYKDNKLIEPVYLYLPKSRSDLNKFLNNISKRGMSKKLEDHLRLKHPEYFKSIFINNLSKSYKVIIDHFILRYIKFDKINRYRYKHYEISINSKKEQE